MKFQLAINLERMDDSMDMREVARHTLEMVQMAEDGGFRIVWSAEHHALEMTIAPDPFQILTWWGAHTSKIRLGTAVAVAVIGFVIAYAVQRLQRMREQRGGRFDSFVREAERASDALERDSLRDESDTATEPRVSIPISSANPDADDGLDVGGELPEGVATR